MTAVITRDGAVHVRDDGDSAPCEDNWEQLEEAARGIGDWWCCPEDDLGDPSQTDGSLLDVTVPESAVARAELKELVSQVRALIPHAVVRISIKTNGERTTAEAEVDGSVDAYDPAALDLITRNAGGDQIMFWWHEGRVPLERVIEVRPEGVVLRAF